MLQCIFSWEPIALRLRWFLRQLVKAIKAIQFFLVVIEWVHSSELPPIIQAGEKANIIIKRACAEAVSRRRCVFFAVFNFA